jgi:hypothetical protein
MLTYWQWQSGLNFCTCGRWVGPRPSKRKAGKCLRCLPLSTLSKRLSDVENASPRGYADPEAVAIRAELSRRPSPFFHGVIC